MQEKQEKTMNEKKQQQNIPILRYDIITWDLYSYFPCADRY